METEVRHTSGLIDLLSYKYITFLP